jgi:hypothetical protein
LWVPLELVSSMFLLSTKQAPPNPSSKKGTLLSIVDETEVQLGFELWMRLVARS